MRIWGAFLALGLLLPLPYTAAAEDEAVTSFTCVRRVLPVMAAEVSGMRLQCEVVGAPSGDQDFLIELDQQPDDVAEAASPELGQRPVCSGSLIGGAGLCSGAVINRASSAFGGTRLSATFLPSGTRLEDAAVAVPPPAVLPGAGTPLRFEPLPDP